MSKLIVIQTGLIIKKKKLRMKTNKTELSQNPLKDNDEI